MRTQRMKTGFNSPMKPCPFEYVGSLYAPVTESGLNHVHLSGSETDPEDWRR